MERLKVRRDFLAAARGHRIAKPAFVLQARDRGDGGPARIGFTVTRRTAKKAVERNRIKRRLRECCRAIGEANYAEGTDYVVIGRRPALTIPFADLAADLAAALRTLGTRREQGNMAGQDRQRTAHG